MRDDEDDQKPRDGALMIELVLVVACMIIAALASLWQG